MSSKTILFIIVASVMGCGGTLEQVKVQAANDLGCSREAIERQALGEYIEKVTGCGKTAVYGYDRNEKMWRSPVERATFDFTCPREQLTVEHLGGREVGVTGCGQKAVYVATCINKIAYMRGVVCEFSGWSQNSATR